MVVAPNFIWNDAHPVGATRVAALLMSSSSTSCIFRAAAALAKDRRDFAIARTVRDLPVPAVPVIIIRSARYSAKVPRASCSSRSNALASAMSYANACSSSIPSRDKTSPSPPAIEPAHCWNCCSNSLI